MEKKLMTVIIVVVLIGTSVGAYFAYQSVNHDNTKTVHELTNRLSVLGNAYADDTIDELDLQYIQAYIDGKSTITVDGRSVELVSTYCDVNNDGSIDAKDIAYVKTIIDGSVTKLYYINSSDKIASVTVPITHVCIAFRRTAETMVVIGAKDMVVAIDTKTASDYAFLNWSSSVVSIGSQTEIDTEKVLALDTKYNGDGGVTVFCESTGSDQTLESDLGSAVDVVRLPVTEYGLSGRGIVTAAFLLSFNADYGQTIKQTAQDWIDWNDGIVNKVVTAAAKLTTVSKVTCLNGLYTGTVSVFNGQANGRGPGVSEYEYTLDAGANNLASKQSSSYTIDEEVLLQLDPSVLVLMCQKSYTYALGGTADTVTSKTVEADSLAMAKSTWLGYTGSTYMIAQEVCTGPAYAISILFYAALFMPDSFSLEEVQTQYAYYMNTFIGNSALAEIPVYAS